LGQLFDRMIPTLKRAILRDSERRPEVLSLEIVYFRASSSSEESYPRARVNHPSRALNLYVPTKTI